MQQVTGRNLLCCKVGILRWRRRRWNCHTRCRIVQQARGRQTRGNVAILVGHAGGHQIMPHRKGLRRWPGWRSIPTTQRLMMILIPMRRHIHITIIVRSAGSQQIKSQWRLRKGSTSAREIKCFQASQRCLGSPCCSAARDWPSLIRLQTLKADATLLPWVASGGHARNRRRRLRSVSNALAQSKVSRSAGTLWDTPRPHSMSEHIHRLNPAVSPCPCCCS
mmetsp:Transcript_32663/g.76574  ORF Transcript_32663/g.76574 Transcript_32663/m.76574 type:complete len:221 (+) Transcript_32663:822-1484(+)